MEEKNESEKSELFLSNISSVKEENEESSFKSHTSRRTRSLGKILYSKTSKSIKKHFIQNNILSLNIKILHKLSVAVNEFFTWINIVTHQVCKDLFRFDSVS